jgi:hypothetical protein
MLEDASGGVKQPMPTRVCPQCGEEYIASAVSCVHCDVALVGSDGIAPARAPRELPPAAQLFCVRTATLAVAQGLSERLSQAGISHRIELVPDEAPPQGAQGALRRRPGELPYGVYVLADDVPAASRVDRDYLRSVLPDLPADHQPGLEGGEGCPACGAPVAPDARECPDCGLALLEPA